MRALLVATAILLAPRASAEAAPRAPVEAAPRERAAVVAIDLRPGAPPYLHDAAAGRIAAGLAAAGYEVMPTAEVAARLTGELARCREGACVRQVGAALGMRSLVFVTIEGKDDNTSIAMRLHDAGTGAQEAEVRDVCDLCGESELYERLGLAASTLRARSLEARARTGKPAAPAPPSGSAPAPGTPAAPASAPAASRSLVTGILAGAAGALAVAAGVYLIAIDGRGTCERGDQPEYPAPGAVIRYPDPSNRDLFVCRDVYRTQVVGIASAGLGVVALAAGAVLVVRSNRGARSVEIAPRPGGVAIRATWSW